MEVARLATLPGRGAHLGASPSVSAIERGRSVPPAVAGAVQAHLIVEAAVGSTKGGVCTARCLRRHRFGSTAVPGCSEQGRSSTAGARRHGIHRVVRPDHWIPARLGRAGHHQGRAITVLLRAVATLGRSNHRPSSIGTPPRCARLRSGLNSDTSDRFRSPHRHGARIRNRSVNG